MRTYPYQMYYPAAYQEQPQKKWPLILFLHGAGERGHDLEKLKQQGLPKYLTGKKDFPFVVASPQCPSGQYWQVPLLQQFREQVLQETRIDPSRVYLTGISMGGYGTWHWASASPDTFAAILPICGGGNLQDASKLAKLPIWAFHGAKDDIVPLEETLAMAEAVEEAGGNVKLTVYGQLYHDSWTTTYSNPAIYDWLLQHQTS